MTIERILGWIIRYGYSLSFCWARTRRTSSNREWTPMNANRFMKIFSFGFLGLLLAATAQAKLNVVATTPDIASIAKEIGGDKIELTTLARPTEDPHFVDAKPSFIV